MRKIVVTVVLALMAWLAVPVPGGWADQGDPPKSAQPPYVHSVIFYLKKDTPAAKREELIADCHKVLGKIPSVRGIWVGQPAAKGTPDFAVKDFHVGLLVLFDNYEGLKTYLEHPIHLKFVEMYSPHIEKVLVYDFMNKAK
jgi:hypothetical protein